MKEERNEQLNIPMDFKMACTIYNFQIHKVLQCFIDHVSFYESLSNRTNGAYSDATSAVVSYPANEENIPHLVEIREIILKCVGELVSLTLQTEIDEDNKREKSIPIVSRLYKSIPSVKVKSIHLQLEKGHILMLSADFCIFCELHNCVPAQLLEHFMEKISLAETSAGIGLKVPEASPAMMFFTRLSKGYCNISPGELPHSELQYDFVDAVQEMHLKAVLIRDFDKRRELYQELYYTHYLKLIELS